MDSPPSLLRRSLAVFALAAALTLAVSLATQITDQIRNDAFFPEEYFSYFTIQTSIANMIALGTAGLVNITTAMDSTRLLLVRHWLMAYAVVTGSVYNLLLRDLPAEPGAFVSDIAFPNEVLHVIIPLYLVADWLFGPHTARLPWSGLGLGLIYPVAWLAVTLMRGDITGWYPYDFLDPSGPGGWATVVGHVVAIALLIAALLAAGLGINRLACRLRGL